MKFKHVISQYRGRKIPEKNSCCALVTLLIGQQMSSKMEIKFLFSKYLQIFTEIYAFNAFRFPRVSSDTV